MTKKLKIALAGNPNVGKSTVFNALTGLKQHTGNWAGKTVENAVGYININGCEITLVDTPGTYSLIPHSTEEEVTQDILCFSDIDGIVVVCDATCLERSLNLALQILEVQRRVVICINLADEAKRAGISIDAARLSELMGCPVFLTSARNKKGLSALKEALCDIPLSPAPLLDYGSHEHYIAKLSELMPEKPGKRWCALRLLEGGKTAEKLLPQISEEAVQLLKQCPSLENAAQVLYCQAEKAAQCCTTKKAGFGTHRPKLDKLLTGRLTGLPIMLLLLAIIFFITVRLANYPSQLLSQGFSLLGGVLYELMTTLSAPDWLISLIIDGIWGVLSWVVSVMLPPMMIFFPLFTLLEDLGYLPRVAFNLDCAFKRCNACGKQALTMAMGLGCNAVGVMGARIIDSPRERMVAILTNSFMPCNGRFPMMITLAGLFIGTSGLMDAAVLTLIIVIGVAATFFASWLLTKTLFKGTPSSFTLELPPFRRPKLGDILVRSLIDRTLFVLRRAVMVAAPAGLVIWLLANITADDVTLLTHLTNFLEPIGSIMGMDGEMLAAFILALPANEIVLPIALMAYTGGAAPISAEGMTLFNILVENGWTIVTAICAMLFSLMHWPCSTTLLMIKKETGKWRYALLAAALPTCAGAIVCIIISLIFG